MFSIQTLPPSCKYCGLAITPKEYVWRCGVPCCPRCHTMLQPGASAAPGVVVYEGAEKASGDGD
jgi:hypothetical protein